MRTGIRTARTRFCVGTSALIIALGTPAAAQAQAAAESAAPDADADSGTGNDIIVTAQRTSQRLQDVPVSVQAVTADTLKEKGIVDLRQLSTVIPSLQVEQDNNYSIRGIGTQSFANTVEGSVATAIDDVTLGSRFLNSNPLLDVSRIEVLNGPQGLLFGKNASAGLVNIVTNRPKLGVVSGDFDAQVTDSNRPDGDAYGTQLRSTINVPIGDRSALRVSGIYVYQQPVIHYERSAAAYGRSETDFRQYGGRAKFLTNLTDQLSLYVIGEYFEAHGIGTIFDNTYRSIATGSVNTAPLAADGVTPGSDNRLQVSDGPQYRDLKTGGAQATLTYDLSNGMSISNIFAWKAFDLDQQIDTDLTGSNGADINSTDAHFNQYSDELRVALPSDGPLTGQVGLYYYHSQFDQASQVAGNSYTPAFLLPTFPFCVGATVSSPSPPGCAVSNDYFLGIDKLYTSTSTSYAAFGQLTYAFSSQFSAFAGGRVTHDRVGIDLTQNTGHYFQVLGVPNSDYLQSYSDTNFSGKVGLQFKPSEDVMLYASYGRGYKGPGMSDTGATPTANLTVYPETTDTFEAGLKSNLLDRRLSLNLSGFYTKFHNFQIQSFDSSLRTFVLGNAAEVTSRGAEATIEARPMDGLTLTANAAYTDTFFDDYLAQCYPTQSTASCVTTGNFDATGNQLPYAPKFTASLGAMYEVGIGRGDTRFFVQGDLYHRSSVQTNANAAPGTRIGEIDLLNGSIGLHGGNWNASIFCRNCTNKVYPLSIIIDSGDASARNSMGQATPRLSLSQRFGLDSTRSVGLRLGYNF